MNWMVAILLLCGLHAVAQDMQSCPMHKEHHQAEVQENGDQAMGFSHEKTTHHFRLLEDGGAIEVAANDDHDIANIEAIRSHLKHIIMMFSDGNFSIPMFIHEQVPPGVDVMKKQNGQISYTYEQMASGARVRIKANSAETLRAVHQFLIFQIEDHQTGDSTSELTQE